MQPITQKEQEIASAIFRDLNAAAYNSSNLAELKSYIRKLQAHVLSLHPAGSIKLNSQPGRVSVTVYATDAANPSPADVIADFPIAPGNPDPTTVPMTLAETQHAAEQVSRASLLFGAHMMKAALETVMRSKALKNLPEVEKAVRTAITHSSPNSRVMTELNALLSKAAKCVPPVTDKE
jgi:hypothetical protein